MEVTATKVRVFVSKNKLVLLMILASIVFDQATKVVAQRNLMTSSHETDLRSYSGERIVLGILGGSEEETETFVSLSLNYVRNLGAAWGMLNNLPDSIRDPFFTIVTIIALFALFHFFKSAAPDNRLLRWAIALIVSGAIGNYLNRIVYGYVIDWIDVRWNLFGWRYAFPNFNWADCAITIGVCILLFEQIYAERKRKKKVLNETTIAN